MPISADIYNAFAPKVQSPQDVTNGLMQQAHMGMQMQDAQLGMQQKRDAIAQDTAMREAVQLSGGDPAKMREALIARGLVKPLQEHDKSQAELLNIAAQQKERESKARENDAATSTKALADYRSMLPLVKTPEHFAMWVDGMFKDPATAKVAQQMGTPDEIKSRIPADPAQFQQFLQQNAMGMDKFMEEQGRNTRNSADIKGRAENTAATVKGHLQAAGIAAATSRANNADTIKKDYTIAGIGADGSPAANVESMAQMIAAGKVAPITGFALARPQGQAVMARVSQINPEYDATTYGAKVKAAKDFGTGPQGNAMRSFAVAGDHLDQLGKLADALNNKDTQAINKIGNYISEQTGNPAPTNFDAAKDIVSKEVVKAIVAGGGGVSEREELARLMDKAKSPAQLKGVITQYRGLMSAQHDHLLQQRTAAGLDPSTLPKYSTEKPAPAAGAYSDAEKEKRYQEWKAKQK